MGIIICDKKITEIEADAIIINANEYLLSDEKNKDVFKAAGDEKLRAACRKIGRCYKGYCKVTSGFNLPSRYIIHTVFPEDKEGIRMTFEKVFDEIKRCRFKTVAYEETEYALYDEIIGIVNNLILDWEIDFYFICVKK